MSVKRKKALIFMLDVIIGMSILIGGVLLMFSYFFTNPTSLQPASYSFEITDFFLSTHFDELASENVSAWLTSEEVDEDMLIAEKMALLCNDSDTVRAQELFEDLVEVTVRNAIPGNLGFSVTITTNETTPCLTYFVPSPLGTSNDSSIYTSSRSPLFAIDNGTLICSDCVLEVAVW